MLHAPIALAGVVIVLMLREQPLRGRDQAQPQHAADPDAAASREPIAA